MLLHTTTFLSKYLIKILRNLFELSNIDQKFRYENKIYKKLISQIYCICNPVCKYFLFYQFIIFIIFIIDKIKKERWNSYPSFLILIIYFLRIHKYLVPYLNKETVFLALVVEVVVLDDIRIHDSRNDSCGSDSYENLYSHCFHFDHYHSKKE